MDFEMDFDSTHAEFDSVSDDVQACMAPDRTAIRDAALLLASTSPRTVEEARAAIVLLDEELLRVASFLDNIHAARQRLHEYINLHDDDVPTINETAAIITVANDVPTLLPESRIQHMPPEILAKIFKRCLPGPSTLTAMHFRAVCVKWRNLADSTSRLWTHISLPDLLAKNVARDTEMVRLWLKRSGGCPLTLNIRCRLDEHPIVEMMLAQSHRWKDVHFTFSTKLIESVAAIKDSLPILRSLNLNISFSPPRVPAQELSLDMFEAAPSLRNVTLPSKLGHTLRLPWWQLTRCNQQGSFEDYFHVLRQCTNLVSSTLSAYHPPIVAPLEAVQHDQLKELRIEQCLDVGTLIDNLTLPALEDISIDTWPYAGTHWPQAKFLEFLTRSKCTIRRLSLKRISMTEAQLIEIIEKMPALVELDVLDTAATVNNELLRLLTRDEDEGASAHGSPSSSRSSSRSRELAPRLESLKLDGALVFSDNKFVHMVESRAHSFPRLKTLVASFNRAGDDEDVFQPLLSLKEDGLVDISLTVKQTAKATKSFDEDY